MPLRTAINRMNREVKSTCAKATCNVTAKPAAMGMASILQFIWPLPDKGLRRRLYRVKAETLVVWGRQDQLGDPVYGEEFAAAIGNARLEVVDGSGHLPQIEQRGRVLSLVNDFLG